MPNATPILVGLIGGIASGKSTVARMLHARGALWIDSDRVAHDVLNSHEVTGLLRERFGEGVIQSDGLADRKAIASFVFGASEAAAQNLKWLESIIHPRVRRVSEERIAADAGRHRVVVIDAPLLLEAGWGPFCDRILFIDTPLPLRQRLASQRGWPIEELQRREAAQLPLDQKRAQASDVITNNGSLEELELQVDRFVTGLTK